MITLAPSTCSTAPPSPSSADAEPERWVTLAECARVLGCHTNTVKSLALGGTIRHRTIPGLRTRYYRPDALKLLAS